MCHYQIGPGLADMKANPYPWNAGPSVVDYGKCIVCSLTAAVLWKGQVLASATNC